MLNSPIEVKIKGMKNQFKEFLNVLRVLNEYDVDYILIGGVAVVIHGYERLTRDIDLFLRDEQSNIEKLRKALSSIYNDESISEITLEELRNYSVIRYGPSDEFCIDLLIAIGEAFSYDDLQSETIEYERIKIKIATPECLYEMKKDTLREKDKVDAAFLSELINKENKGRD